MKDKGHSKQVTSCEVLSSGASKGTRSKEQVAPKLVLLRALGLGSMYTHTRFDCTTRSPLGDATPHTLAFLVHGFWG
jgi:hypothetical protein